MKADDIWQSVIAFVVGVILLFALLDFDVSQFGVLLEYVIVLGFGIAFSVAVVRRALS